MTVPMRHRNPDTGDIDVDSLGEASSEAQFTGTWEPRGWERVDPAEAELILASGVQTATVDGLPKRDLSAAAADLGVEVPKTATKSQIIKTARRTKEGS